VVLLCPAWAAIGAAATLDEIETILTHREEGRTWRECAAAADLLHRPSTHRRWQARFRPVMEALLPRFPHMPLAGGHGWMNRLRAFFHTQDQGVLLKLRWLLYNAHKIVLGPLQLLGPDRLSPRSPPSP
jgi:hypothetical protein